MPDALDLPRASFLPSNSVECALELAADTATITADAMFDTDTGAITGSLVRAAGEGVNGGVGFIRAPGLALGPALGIFVFRDLTINEAVTARFVGTRAVVLLVIDTATIAGKIDVSAGRDLRSMPGPGGGAGGTIDVPAQGCGAGGRGAAGTDTGDGGGGGGGGGKAGGQGGDGLNRSDMVAARGGIAGKPCMPADLQPLQGGGGGGAGSPGKTVIPSHGGGGGGGLQITALGALMITGQLHAGGDGGDGGAASPPPTLPDPAHAGAGGGGGSGGGILLEAPTVTISGSAVIAANGGGGGGGGDGDTGGQPGSSAQVSTSPAPGGLATMDDGVRGGSGGAAAAESTSGGTGISNGGGGGGGVGAIVVRGATRSLVGTFSPAPTELVLMPATNSAPGRCALSAAPAWRQSD